MFTMTREKMMAQISSRVFGKRVDALSFKEANMACQIMQGTVKLYNRRHNTTL